MKRRILLVDDELAILLTLKAVLEINGFEVETATSAAEAKSKLSEVLREAAQGPTVIHSRGKDLAVVLAMEDYE